MRTNDSHVQNLIFRPRLFFTGYDGHGRPIIITDIIPDDVYDSNRIELTINPPVQGVPKIGSKVRLRHRDTGLCIYSIDKDGVAARNAPCDDLSSFTYVIDDAADGYVRLQHQNSSQCLYTIDSSSYVGPLYNWGCWDDTNMRFLLDPSIGGFALRHVNTYRCAFSDHVPYGVVLGEPCYGFIALGYIYQIDIVQYPPRPCLYCDHAVGPIPPPEP